MRSAADRVAGSPPIIPCSNAFACWSSNLASVMAFSLPLTGGVVCSIVFLGDGFQSPPDLLPIIRVALLARLVGADAAFRAAVLPALAPQAHGGGHGASGGCPVTFS